MAIVKLIFIFSLSAVYLLSTADNGNSLDGRRMLMDTGLCALFPRIGASDVSRKRLFCGGRQQIPAPHFRTHLA